MLIDRLMSKIKRRLDEITPAPEVAELRDFYDNMFFPLRRFEVLDDPQARNLVLNNNTLAFLDSTWRGTAVRDLIVAWLDRETAKRSEG